MRDQIPRYDEPLEYKRPVAWVTWIILGTTIEVFLVQLLVLHLNGEDLVGDALAFSPQAMAEHRYWTLLTYAWAHAVAMFGNSSLFWLHIVANMIPLICLGPALEEILGHLRFVGLYLGGAAAAVLVWYAFNRNAGPDDMVIGASGAVFAIIAAVGTAMPRVRVTVLFFFIVPLRMSMWVLAVLACAVEAAQIVFRWMPQVAHSAHLGGAAFGFLYVMTLRLLHRGDYEFE